MTHKTPKIKNLVINRILYSLEKRKVLLISILLCSYLICFKYASLCNLIKLVIIYVIMQQASRSVFKQIKGVTKL